MHTKTASLECYLTLPKDKEMLLGGDYANVNIYLKYPMIVQPGDKFTGVKILTWLIS